MAKSCEVMVGVARSVEVACHTNDVVAAPHSSKCHNNGCPPIAPTCIINKASNSVDAQIMDEEAYGLPRATDLMIIGTMTLKI